MLPAATRLSLLSLLLLAAACHPNRSDPKTVAPTIQQLEGTWLASHEENRGDTLVYRPNTYHFPPARGRTGFAFKPFGRFEQFDLAPTDGLASRTGTWTAYRNTRLRINLNQGSEPDYTLQIISLENQVLKLRRRP